jgi:hypothetical protein
LNKPSGKGRSTKTSFVLVFGEDDHDRECIKILLEGLRPDLARRVQKRRQPLVLLKNANPADVPDRAQRIALAVDAERDAVACVFAHEDCDAVEPAHDRVAAKIESALRAAGLEAHAVVPAWEMEAWWFLWPEAVKAAFPSWRAPDDHAGRNVGMIRNAKEELRRRVTPSNAKRGFLGYRESDAPLIAARVVALGLLRMPKATSKSYTRFVQSAAACKA